MKQVLQDLQSGKTWVAEVPVPTYQRGEVLVRVVNSLLSTGTERMLVEFSEKSILGKARSRPDLVQSTLTKARHDGILTTLQAVRNRLRQPLLLGYSCAGVITAVGERVDDLAVGTRVACGGANRAVHAEYVAVPRNLVVKIPDAVDFEAASFTTLGAIAINGFRLGNTDLGEVVAVIGLGLVGQLTVQIAQAAGCQCICLDPLRIRADLASKSGAKGVATTEAEFVSLCDKYSEGRGVDAVLIAAASESNEPVSLAGRICRDRGAVVVVGKVGLEIPHETYFRKELFLRVARSYGPGRYDREYEEKGHDYPFGFVRWTENRNMQAFVELLTEKKVSTTNLISQRIPLDEAPKAYRSISAKGEKPPLAIILSYPTREYSESVEVLSQRLDLGEPLIPSSSERTSVGILGAGLFATGVLLPAMKRDAGTLFAGVCAASGSTARNVADRFGFQLCTTNEKEILESEAINVVAVITRHNLHAEQVIASLKAEKHVFCEKPLCLNEEELQRITETYFEVRNNSSGQAPRLMVGFNRRFAPMIQRMREFFGKVHSPISMHYRVNAGQLPADHWINDMEIGGGRILGEVCHFVDTLSYLAGSLPESVYASALANDKLWHGESIHVLIEYLDGSVGTITYLANGDPGYPKERLEVFGGKSVAVMDNFRRLELIRKGRRRVQKSRLKQNKGHEEEWLAFVKTLREGQPSPIPFHELVATTKATFAIVESLRTKNKVTIEHRQVN